MLAVVETAIPSATPIRHIRFIARTSRTADRSTDLFLLYIRLPTPVKDSGAYRGVGGTAVGAGGTAADLSAGLPNRDGERVGVGGIHRDHHRHHGAAERLGDLKDHLHGSGRRTRDHLLHRHRSAADAYRHPALAPDQRWIHIGY